MNVYQNSDTLQKLLRTGLQAIENLVILILAVFFYSGLAIGVAAFGVVAYWRGLCRTRFHEK